MKEPNLHLGNITTRLLIFGGPYSNLAATQALLQKAESLNIEKNHIICTGDIIAYCAEAEQTCQLIAHSGIHVIMGNCEESLALEKQDCGCGFEPGMACSTLSEQWYRYANTQVSDDSRKWMRTLPRSIRFDMQGKSFRVIHGGVAKINQFIFASSDQTIKLAELKLSQTDIVIGGHCGIPFGECMDSLAWLNAGVIGLPANEGTTSTWFMMITPEDTCIQVSWHRLEYEYSRTYESMLAEGLLEYAQTINSGIWPSMDILPEEEQQMQGNTLQLPPLNIF